MGVAAHLRPTGSLTSFLNQPLQVGPLREQLRALIACRDSLVDPKVGLRSRGRTYARRDPSDVVVNLTPREKLAECFW
jgi:hypothetical protein